MLSSSKTSHPRPPDGVYYYSILRFMPDPVREEFINVGLALVDATRSYSRFSYNRRIKVRLDCIGAGEFLTPLIGYLERLSSTYDVSGKQSLEPRLAQEPLSPERLSEWKSVFGGAVRVTPPQVLLADDPDTAFRSLYTRLIGTLRGEGAVSDLEEPTLQPEQERNVLLHDFVAQLRRLPNFDIHRVLQDKPFRGVTREHWLDVVITGQERAPSFAHAIPFRARETKPVFLHRGAVLDAAGDSDGDAVRIVLFDDPPVGREGLLIETQRVLAEHKVQMYRRDDLAAAAGQFEDVLLRA